MSSDTTLRFLLQKKEREVSKLSYSHDFVILLYVIIVDRSKKARTQCRRTP